MDHHTDGIRRLVQRIIKTYGLKLKDGHVERVVEELKGLDISPVALPTVAKSLLDIGESYFFRDVETWNEIENLVKKRRYKNINMLSLGCSYGEEVYTFSFVVRKHVSSVKMVGIDADESRIEHARRALYEKWKLRNIPEDKVSEYFMKEGELFKVKDFYKKDVFFEVSNVIFYDIEYIYDFIFARRIFIYLERRHIRKIAEKISISLKDNGFLILGKGEIYEEILDLFEPVRMGDTIFWRTKTSRLTESDEVRIFEKNITRNVKSYEEIIKNLINKKLYDEALIWIDNAKEEGYETPNILKYEIAVYLNKNDIERVRKLIKVGREMYPEDKEIKELEGLWI